MQQYNLPLSNDIKCLVSPMVVMSILNFHQRRHTEETEDGIPTMFTVGLLFGYKDGSDVHITDCFPIPCRLKEAGKGENEEEAEIDDLILPELAIAIDTTKKAIAFFKFTQPDSALVGWFTTGLDYGIYSKQLHNHFLSNANDSNNISRTPKVINQSINNTNIDGSALDDNVTINLKSSMTEFVNGSDFIHLMVDSELTQNELNVKAFIESSWMNPHHVYQYSLQQTKTGKINTQARKGGKKKKRKNKKSSQNNENNANNGNNENENNKNNDKNTNNNANTNDNSKKNENENKNEEKENDNKEDNEEKIEEPRPVFSRFVEIPLEFYASNAEKIGLDAISKAPPQGKELDAPGMLLTDLIDLQYTLQDLYENLEKAHEYVQSVKRGEIEADDSIGWTIAEAVSTVPTITPEKFEKSLTNRLQDLLMISYLGKMTEAQLTVADRINQVLYKTIPKHETD